jgi:nicotinate-nucleotide pyrophosphorylase (carboxylating)
MRFTQLSQVIELVTANGLDADAVALIVSEALGEDLGGRGVLPPGTGSG